MMAGKLLLGKVALITGAAGGIGGATAQLFAQHGALLSLLDLDALKLQSIADECNNINPASIKTFTFVGDISDEKCCQDYIENTVKTFGRIDILINCAGIVKHGFVDESKILDSFDKVLAVNIRAIVAVSSLAIPHLKKTQGNIVSIASIAAHRTFSGVMAYGVSKAAVKAYTQYAAAELASFKVRVNCISPGVIDTPLVQNPQASAEVNEQFVQEYARKHALGRIGKPSEIAQSILFLASDITASFITGSDFIVDGGYCIFNEKSANLNAVCDK